MLVEARDALVDRVDDDEPRGDSLGDADNTLECLGEQHATKPLTLERSIEREAGEQHGGDLTGSAASESAWKLRSLQKVCRNRIVGHDCLIVPAPDKGSRCAPHLRRVRVVDQPLVELPLTTFEPVQPMSLAQLLRGEVRLGYRCTTRRVRLPARTSAGLGLGSSSSAESSRSKKSGGTIVTAS